MNDSFDGVLDLKQKIALWTSGIIFLLQIMLFMYFFNFNGLPLFWVVGWTLLIPGFLLLGVSRINTEDSWIKKSVSRRTSQPLPDGWLIVCIALAMISQHWLSYLCVLGQLPLIIFVFYYE